MWIQFSFNVVKFKVQFSCKAALQGNGVIIQLSVESVQFNNSVEHIMTPYTVTLRKIVKCAVLTFPAIAV